MANNDPLDPASYYDAYIEQSAAPQQQRPQMYVPALDPATLPKFALNDRRGWLMPGIQAGVQDVGGLLAGSVGAVGGALGMTGVRDWGIEQMRGFEDQAQQVGRPDLDVMPWSAQWGQDGKTLADVPEWLGYQAAKQIPQFGLAMAGGGLAGRLGAVQKLAAPLAETAATLPRYMGGGALNAGMNAEARAEALAAGNQLANQYVGTTIAGLPAAAGSMYQSEVDRAEAMGDQPRQGAAIASLVGAPLYAAVDALAPSSEVGMLRRGLEGNIAKRVGTAALSEGVQESIQEGIQTGMEMAFRPDLSPVQKAQNMIDATLTGFAVGGVFGAPGGVRRLAKADPATTTTDDLREAAAEAVPPGAPPPASTAATPPPPPPGAPPPPAGSTTATPPGAPPPPAGSTTATPPGAPPPATPLTAEQKVETEKALRVLASAINDDKRPTNAADIKDLYESLQQLGKLTSTAGKAAKKAATFYGLIDSDGNTVPLDQARATVAAYYADHQRRLAEGKFSPEDTTFEALGHHLQARLNILDAILNGGDLTSVLAPSINNTAMAAPSEKEPRRSRRRKGAPIVDEPSSLDGPETETPPGFVERTPPAGVPPVAATAETPPAGTPPAASASETPPAGVPPVAATAETPPAPASELRADDAEAIRAKPEIMRELAAMDLDELRRRGIKDKEGVKFSDGSVLHAEMLSRDDEDVYHIDHPDGTRTWISELGKVHAAVNAAASTTPAASTSTAATPPAPAPTTDLHENDAAAIRAHPEIMRALAGKNLDELRKKADTERAGAPISDGVSLHIDALGPHGSDSYLIRHPDGKLTEIYDLGKVHAAVNAAASTTPAASTSTAATPPAGSKTKTTSPSRPAPGTAGMPVPTKVQTSPEYLISNKNAQTLNKLIDNGGELLDGSKLTWRDGKRGAIKLTRPDGSVEEFANATVLKNTMVERHAAAQKTATTAATPPASSSPQTPPATPTETAAEEPEKPRAYTMDNWLFDGEDKRSISVFDGHVFWNPKPNSDEGTMKISLGGREYDRRKNNFTPEEAIAAGAPKEVADAIKEFLSDKTKGRRDRLMARVASYFDGETQPAEGETAASTTEGETTTATAETPPAEGAKPPKSRKPSKKEQEAAAQEAYAEELRGKRAVLDATGAVRIDDVYFTRDEDTGLIRVSQIENGKKVPLKGAYRTLSDAYTTLGLAMPKTAEQRAREQLAAAETASAEQRWRSAASPGKSNSAADRASEVDNADELEVNEPEDEAPEERKGRGKSMGTSFKSKSSDADIEAVKSLRESEETLDADQKSVLKKAGNALTDAVRLLLSPVPMSSRNMALSSDSGLKELDFDVLAEALAKAGSKATGLRAETEGEDTTIDKITEKAIDRGVYRQIITLAAKDRTAEAIRETIGNKMPLADIEELVAHVQKYKPRPGRGLRLGPAGQPITTLMDVDLPVRSVTSVGKLLNAMIKTTGGDKRLRAMAGLLNKFAAKTKVIIVPRDDLKAATGFDGFYDTAEKVIYLPYDPSMTNDEVVHAFLHEAVHGALHDKLTNSPAARTQLMLLARKLAKDANVNRSAYAFTDAHEFLSEAMSNSELQDQLEKLTLSAREAYQMGVGDAPTGFAAFVNMVKEWLGWRAPISGLEAAMRIQDQIARDDNIAPKGVMNYINSELQGVGIGNFDKLLSSTSDAEIETGKQAVMAASRQLVSGVDSSLRGVVLGVDKLMSSVSKESLERGTAADSSLRIAIRKMELYWSNFGHILQKFGKLFKNSPIGNPLEAYGKHMTQRQALTARMAQLWRNVNDQWTAVLKRSPNIAKELKEKLDTVMRISTEFGIDPEKLFKDQAHLVTASNSAMLREQWQKAHDALEFIKNSPHGSDVFQKLRAVNNSLMYAYQAIQLYNMVRSDPFFHDSAGARPSMDMTRTDPVDDFLSDKTLHEDPVKSEEYWRTALEGRLAETKAYLKYMQGQNDAGLLTKKEGETFNRASKPLNKLERDIRTSMANIGRAPYFHLGRHGDYIVRFDIRRDPDDNNKVDPVALTELVDALKDEFPDVHISKATEHYHVMARFESANDRNRFHDAVKALEDRGLVTPGETKTGEMSNMGSMASMQPDWLARYIENIKSDTGLTDAQRDAMISTARITWLDMLPDTAVVRVLAERKNVPGYHGDMLRNFAFRAEVGVNALANLSIAAKISEAFTEMKNEYRKASEDTSRRTEAVMMHQVIEELQKRDADRPSTTGTDWIDRLRAWNHSFFLGASPAYVLVNMTQLGVMLWPELAKRHSFVQSAKVIASVTPLAFKIIKATFNQGRKLGWSRSLDAIITHDALREALPGDDDAKTVELRDFLERMINSGNIDLGSPMRELGRKSTGTQDKWDDHALRLASVMGYYSETLSRLIAVLSAHKLETDKAGGMTGAKLDRYAGAVLNDAMLNYSNWYTARATGKAGVLGRFTPVPASFQQYTMQVIQKLYRETYDAVSGQQTGEDEADVAKRKSEARRFLMGHSTTIAMLAGTLGLPFSSVAFRLVDGLRDALGDDDDEPHDTKVDYRNWLATVFGEDVGEVIARGLPHAFGFDVSSRVGEQDIGPLSRFIADRRKMEDAVKDLAMRSWGSPVSMTLNVLVGASEFAKGNYMQSLQMMMPKAISDGLKASDMVMHGYRDEQGRKLPMSADPADIAYQALGFKPADKAEYLEENLARVTRKTQMQERASQLRNEVVDAIENDGDVQGKTRKAASFGAKNPAFAPLPSLASTMGRRRKQEAVARALAAPIGYNVQDTGERDFLRFGNYGPDR